MMKILLLACLNKNNAGNSYGGAEKSIINLANWLADNTNNEVYLVSVEGNEKPFEISKNVQYFGNNIEPKSKINTHLKILRNTKKAVKDIKPNVIISFWIQPLFYLWHINKNIKIIYSERNDPRLEYGNLARFMRKIVLNRCNHIVFQTKEAQNYFSSNIKEKSTVIQNPVYISSSDFQLKNDTNNSIVTVGRLNTQKNQKLLIQAFYNIKDIYPNLNLEIFGEGLLRKELQDFINQKNLENRVFLRGAFPNIFEKIVNAKLFVLPSIYEGMPNALMEAMSLGICVLSSDCPCGGPRELIVPGKNGYLFKNNDLDDLINKMKDILNKNQYNVRLEAKNICTTNSQNVIFKKWYDIIK